MTSELLFPLMDIISKGSSAPSPSPSSSEGRGGTDPVSLLYISKGEGTGWTQK